jgi:hypothetical protein
MYERGQRADSPIEPASKLDHWSGVPRLSPLGLRQCRARGALRPGPLKEVVSQRGALWAWSQGLGDPTSEPQFENPEDGPAEMIVVERKQCP